MTGLCRGWSGQRPRSLLAAALLLAALLLPAASLHGQSIDGLRAEVGAEPARVTVGEPFTAALRVVAPAGVRVEYGEPAPTDSLHLLAPLELGPGDGDDGEIALYRMVAWVAEAPLRAVVPVRLTVAGGEIEERWVRLHLPEVVSVLPDGEEAIEPRPAKAVVSPPLIGQETWFWWLLLVGVLLAILLAYLWLDRARRVDEEATMPVDPRAWALRQLDLAAQDIASDAPEKALAHHRVARILRSYCALVNGAWSPDLTTSEVIVRVSEEEGEVPGRELGEILRAADEIRFGGAHVPPGSAGTLIERARAWVTEHPAGMGRPEGPRTE